MRVMVIVSDQRYECGGKPFPPVGTIGTVVGGLDQDGEYDVMFDNYPSPLPLDPAWFTHKSMIVFIDDEKETVNKEALAELDA
jgi:hypothetical protein